MNDRSALACYIKWMARTVGFVSGLSLIQLRSEKLGNILFILLNTKVMPPLQKKAEKSILQQMPKTLIVSPHASPSPPGPSRLLAPCFRKISPPKAEPYKNLLLNSQQLGLLDMKSDFRRERKRHSVVTCDLQKISTRREKGMRTENTQLDKNSGGSYNH